MLKFIGKVFLAGEVNDFRRSYKKRKIKSKLKKKEMNTKILEGLAQHGELDDYYEALGKGTMETFVGFTTILMAPFAPPVLLATPVLLVLGFKNFSLAFKIRKPHYNKVIKEEQENMIKNMECIVEINRLKKINEENKNK